MPKIEIIEIDETTPGPLAESTDVVYIPGFVDYKQSTLYDNEGNYIGLETNVPTLFTSVKSFETRCGKTGMKFTKDQLYTDLIAPIEGTANYKGFSENARPYHNVMFNEGAMDPSYIMAKEYLSAGLNVLYERVNKGLDYVPVYAEPENWAAIYNSYYTVPRYKDGEYVDCVTYSSNPTDTTIVEGDFVLIKENVAPKFYHSHKIGENYDANKTYYKFNPTTQTLQIVTEDEMFTKDGKKETNRTSLIGEFYTIIKDFYKQSYISLPVGTYNNVVWVSGYYYKLEDGQYKELTLEEFNEYVKKDSGDEYTIYRLKYVNGVMNAENTESIPIIEWETTYTKYYDFIEGTKSIIPKQLSTPNFYSLGTVYELTEDATIVKMYNTLPSIYNSSNIYGLADKGNFNFKYLTSGGYPVYEYSDNSIVNNMLDLAKQRGDCVAIIDHTDNTDRSDNIDHTDSLYNTVKNDANTFNENGEYGTMFTPWAEYNRSTVDMVDSITMDEACGPTRLPASFAYFMALGDSIKTNANWLAIAGSARGIVPNLTPDGMTTNIPNGAADAMQERDAITINPITNIKPYGWTIWGNRTLKNNAVNGNLVATSFLNIRNLISDVKKTVYRVARKLTFEQNNDVLWVNFKGLIAPTLDRMVSGYGISGYKILRDTTHEKASEKATLCAKVILYPVYAVEDFYITIVLKDDEVSVE